MKKNRYKFKNFQERLSSIKLDVVHRISKPQDVPEDEQDSFLNEGLQKWRELDCSETFVSFDREVRPLVSSFNLVVFHKDSIMEIMLKHLGVEESLSYQALLDLVVQFAKDLQQDFCPFFGKFLEVMIGYLHRNDAELMEHTFVALAYIFKHLWRHMIQDLDSVFRIYKTLLQEHEKPHIVDFASESFAFLLRKSFDHGNTLEYIFKAVVGEPSLADGIGHLLFNTIKGTKLRFHSCAEDLFSTMLLFLNSEKCCAVAGDVADDMTQQVCICLCALVTCACKSVSKEHVSTLWLVISERLKHLVDASSINASTATVIEIMDNLKIATILVSWKDGIFLREIQDSVVQTLLSVLDLRPVGEYTSCDALVELIISLCLYGELHGFNRQAVGDILKKCFKGCLDIPQLKTLVSGLAEWTLFEDVCLPSMLDFVQDGIFASAGSADLALKPLEILSAYVISKTDAFDQPFTNDASGLKLNLLKITKLKQGRACGVVDLLLTLLTKFDASCDNNDLEATWFTAYCLPYIYPRKHTSVSEALAKVFGSLLASCEALKEEHLFLFAVVVKSIAVLCKTENVSLSTIVKDNDMRRLIRLYPTSVHVLQSYDVYLCSLKENKERDFSISELQDLVGIVMENISSPSHLHRVLALRMLSYFDQYEFTALVDDEEITQKSQAIALCLSAEETPGTFQRYRDRLLWIEKLAFCDGGFKDLPAFYMETALRFLISNLYINLRPMWEPVKETIASFAAKNPKTFWETWKNILNSADEKADHQETKQRNSFGSEEDIFVKCLRKATQKREDNRGDAVNFYRLMWEAMANFPNLVEGKSRDVMGLFFKFLRNHYFHRDESIAPSQDIRCSSDVLDTTTSGNDESRMELDSIKRWSKDDSSLFLLAALKLFSLFRNPRALHREPEFRNLMFDLLTHKDGELQKLSLACLIAYKFDYLLPYKENFDRLLEDTSFRGELLLFSADQENDVIKLEHRAGLWPVITRLLFGKMQRRSGLGVSGKSGISNRRNVLMQFISNSSVSEMKTFVDLVTAPFSTMMEDKTENDVNLAAVVPTRKQTSFLNMMHHVFTRLGHLVSDYLPLFFDIILELLAFSQTCLLRRSEVSPMYLSRIKEVRQLGITRLCDFFSLFPEFDYRPFIERIFKHAVSPQLSQLADQCQSGCTPLMKLFLIWSGSSRLLPLLGVTKKSCGNVTPVSALICCLELPRISNDAIALLFTVMENLLSKEDFVQTDDVASVIEGERNGSLTIGVSMLQPHVDVMLAYLKARLKSKSKALFSIKKGPLPSQHIPEQELAILSKLSQFVVDPQQCQTMVSVLLPLLNKIKSSATKVNILHSVEQLLKNCQDPSQFTTSICSLFSSVAEISPRRALCQAFAVLCLRCSHLAPMQNIVLGLNAWNPKRLDEPDYDKRFEALREFDKITSDQSITEEFYLFVVHNCLKYILHDDDISLRNASSSCLSKIIDVCHERKGKFLQLIVQQTLLPAVRHGLHSKNIATRQEFIFLLSHLVRQCSDCDNQLYEMKKLQSENVDADFFENIRHIQMHRRIRAVRRLSSLCQESALSSVCLCTYLLPIVSHFVFDVLAAKDHNLLTETIATMGHIAKELPWSKYCHMLRSYLKLLPKEKRRQKSVVRVIVAILDSFHFDLTKLEVKQDDVVTVSGKAPRDDDKEDDDKAEEEEDPVADGNTDAAALHKIHSTVTEKIIPQLRRALTKKSATDGHHKLSHNKEDDDEDVLRVPVVLAMIKLLQQLPKETFHLHLPGMLLRVCETLRSRARDVRDTARDTLVKICISLGPEYLGVVLKEMRTALKRGYQLHVLGFTLHAILEALVAKSPTTTFDHAIDGVIEVLVNDIFGDTSEEKEVEAITGKLHEAKAMKSFDSFEIIARVVSKSHLLNIINPVKEVMETNQNYKSSKKIEQVLRRIGVGLQNNHTLSETDLLQFVHGVATLTLKRKPKEDKRIVGVMSSSSPALASKEDVYMIPKRPERGQQMPTNSKATNSHLLLEFGLQLVHVNLKRGRFSSNTELHVQMLDPFVSMLLSALKSHHNKVVMAAMRCFSFLIKFPLPALQSNINDLARSLFKLLKTHARVGASHGENLELVQTTFKTMTAVIRDYTNFKATENQLKILLTYVEEDVCDYTRHATAFPLLKAILSRRLTAPAIFDVMSKVAELSVSNENASTRQQCRQLEMQFLLDYPLGKKLNKQLEFYIAHLAFEMEYGRESVFQMLIMIFTAFPEEMLSDRCGTFFVPLAMSVTNDDSADCRRLASVAIKALIAKIGESKVDYLFDLSMTWMKGNKVAMKCLAVQLTGIFCEAEKSNFEKRLSLLLPEVFSVLAECSEKESSRVESEDEDDVNTNKSNAQHNHLLFNCLSCLSKVLLHCNWSMHLSRDQESSLWGAVTDNLLHRHTWIRLVCAQLLGLLFASLKPDQLVACATGLDAAKRDSSKEPIQYLADGLTSKVTDLTRRCCDQLKSNLISEELANQIVKNLVFLSKLIFLINSRNDLLGKEVSSEDEDETASSLNTGKRPTLTVPSIEWSLDKLCRIASYEAAKQPKSTTKRMSVFKYIAALVVDLCRVHTQRHLVDMLGPLHREINNMRQDAVETDLQVFGQEVMDLLKGIVGKDAFAESYAQLQQKVNSVKETRKRKLALQAVSEPEKSIARKQHRNVAKRQQRKRKLVEKKPVLALKMKRSGL